MDSEIKIEVKGFVGHYKSTLHIADLQQFYDQLLNVENQTARKAMFSAIEDDLDLEFTLGSRGDVLCIGVARYEGNSLTFQFNSDLFTVHEFIKSLNSVLQRYK